MKLKEIEFDLLYRENAKHIKNIQQTEKIDYAEAVKKDYQLNWKKKRREFQLMTRCMTSFVERIMEEVDTKECWKIIFECVDTNAESGFKNLLGAYCIQVEFDYMRFCTIDNKQKKNMIIDTIICGLKKTEKIIGFEITSIIDACEKVKKMNYNNEWLWGKPIKNKDLYAQIKITHDINMANINIIYMDSYKTIIKEEVIISTEPDERFFGKYLRELKWTNDNKAVLHGD